LPLALTTFLHEAAGICADDSSDSKPILAKCVEMQWQESMQ